MNAKQLIQGAVNKALAAGGTPIVEQPTGAALAARGDYAALMAQAMAAGAAAVAKINVRPMVVQQRANPADDSSPVVKQYFVADGVCGFAGVTVKGVGKFANWIKANKDKLPGLYIGKGYPTGLHISIGLYNQSLQKKEAYAYAMADILREAGIKAYGDSRMD